MNVLGVSCHYHDAAAALLSDGELVAAAEEERFSRRKHDSAFPARAIRFCLERGGLAAGDMDRVVFYEQPFEKLERILLTVLQTWPSSRETFREAMPAWFGDKLWIRQTLEERLGVSREKILFARHHLSHAASAFLPSPFGEAAFLTVDGVGEWATATWGVGRDTEVRIHREIRFPHSLGLLYSTFTAFLGFQVNEGEYKVMGMAPYGEPRYLEEVRRLIRQHADGSFDLDMDYFSFHRSATRMHSARFEALFGPPRAPGAPFFGEAGASGDRGAPDVTGGKLRRLDQRHADLAASVQRVTEEVLLEMARAIRRETGMKALCLAGGVALNSVANGRILREAGFDELWIQPAPGDGGGALGAALWAYHTLLGRPRRLRMRHAYWGADYGPGEVEAVLRREGVAYDRVPDEGRLLDRTATALARGMVVGWFQGRFEWGPRALGNRSILADPRRAEMKDVVNSRIKFREPFRPFAPAVPVAAAGGYFDLDDPAGVDPTRFMLVVAPVRPGARASLPAVTHVDGSARLQTVFPDESPRFHGLLTRFGDLTGVPVLLNTSFNLRGEPIVTTPEDALSTFRRSGLDLLVMGDCLVSRG